MLSEVTLEGADRSSDGIVQPDLDHFPWSKWEVINQAMVQFGEILPFLERNEDVGLATRQKLLPLLKDVQKCSILRIELAAVVDYGEPFVKATYNLEGDGDLVFTCYEGGSDCPKFSSCREHSKCSGHC